MSKPTISTKSNSLSNLKVSGSAPASPTLIAQSNPAIIPSNIASSSMSVDTSKRFETIELQQQQTTKQLELLQASLGGIASMLQSLAIDRSNTNVQSSSTAT